MVRGNWQKRVERTEARRRDAKQKKAKSEEKRIFKGLAQEAFAFLDRPDVIDSIRRRSSDTETWRLHIWTDSLPSESPPLLDMLDNYNADGCDPQSNGGGGGGGGKNSRKARSSSIEDSDAAMITDNSPSGGGKGKGKKGRGKPGFYRGAGEGNNKKVHPRSKEGAESPSTTAEASVSAPLLCKSQFFAGKCHNPQRKGNKGAGCRRVHYNNKYLKTLAEVMGTNRQHQGELEKAEEACAMKLATSDTSSDTANNDAMEMVYYLCLSIPKDIGTNDTSNQEEEINDNVEGTTDANNEPNQNTINNHDTIAHLITEALNSNNCSVSSLVYMVLTSPSHHNTLIFDRNRDGIVIKDFAAQVLGTSGGDDEASSGQLAQNLSISILEHILTFSEAPAVAAASQVCSAWHREIRSCSPSLWRHLLQQRNWPVPASAAPGGGSGGVEDDGAAMDESLLHDRETSAALAVQLRTEFVQHYSVLRDMRAIQMALTSLLTKRSAPEEEMTYQAFSTRRGAPQSPNNCVAIEIWGPNQVLAAYSDNTLRLFQAQARSSNNNKNHGSARIEKSCRELLCQSIDPFNHSKKKNCFLEAMGLDEDVVGCLCSVSDESSDDKTPHVLIVLPRDDLLVVDYSTDTAGRVSGPEEGALRVIDVEEAVLNYVLSLDQVDHRLLRLHDFLALGGDQDEVEFIVSQSMAACGFGRFMLEVAISIPNNEDNVEDEMIMLDRKLFLLSASLGAIVWMGDSNAANASDPLPSRLEDMTLSSLRRAFPGGGSRTSCTVASVSHALAPLVSSVEIEPSGHIGGHHVLGSSEWSRSERLLGEGWSLRPDGKRPMVVTTTDVVVGDSLATQQNRQGERDYKATITFYSRFPGLDDGVASIAKLIIGENCTIDSMISFRDEYVILLVRFFTETGLAAVDGGGGHWGFGDRVARVFALTIHVPSRREIERMCLYEDFGMNKLTIAVAGDTVACGVWLKGLIMTGSDVRSVGTDMTGKPVLVLEDAAGKASKKKDKKKRRSKGGGKKDGFARGQSLRG